MPLDPYALCPGGRDKKIRFCCPNMLKELEQVIQLLESGQPSACLAYIETIEKTHPDCACLTKAKISIHRAEERWDDVLHIAEQFYRREPENPAAAAEYALALTITGNAKLAVETLIDAFERSETGKIHSGLLQGALQVATYLVLGGHITPALGIGRVLRAIPVTAEKANLLLYRATSEDSVPLIIRDWDFDYNCPDAFPGKETFEEAAVFIRLMRWKEALALLEPLTQHADTWPTIWRNIATIQLWLLDNDKATEALKMYASLPNTPTDDAVDAEMFRLLNMPNPLGDPMQVLNVEYIISDADKALESLLSSSMLQQVDLPPGVPISPPPRGFFMLMSRPFPEAGTPPTLENWPLLRGIVMLFGKETDREARLDIHSLPDYERENAEQVLRDSLGDMMQFPGNILEERPASKTQSMLEYEFCFPSLERRNNLGRFDQLSDEYKKTKFIESWLASPLGLLDGKTPSEATAEPKYKIPLLVAVRIIETWYADPAVPVGDILRTRLGLPQEEIITLPERTDPQETAGDAPLAVLDDYPVWRWHRFNVEKLPTEVLAEGLEVVLGMYEFRSASRFAEEILNRPLDSMDFEIRIMAFEALIADSHRNGNVEQAFLWVDRAKNESTAKGISVAAWYIHEITLHLSQGNGKEASAAIAYLMKNHGDEPDVMEALHKLFIQLGMFNPDGTPSEAWSRALSNGQADREAEQQIWTPDAAVPGNTTPPSKLWVPD